MHGSPAPAPRSTSVGVPPASPVGAFVRLDGEDHYRISGYHRMQPFLVSLASDTDLWMSITSGGGLTAGRVDPDGCIFPYLTVDQLHDAHCHTGPVTLIRVEQAGGPPMLWEPFSDATAADPGIERNLYKNSVGNRLVFEEVNRDLNLVFRYGWSGSEEFGWVRTSTLENRGTAVVTASLLDGLRNVLPYGAPLALYQQASNLVDAYKKSEIDSATGLAVFSLTAGITDRAEALEVLRANTVWCSGLAEFAVHLSHAALAAFRDGREMATASTLNGARGNFLVSCELRLGPGKSSRWRMAADVGRDHMQIAELRRRLLAEANLDARIDESLRRTEVNLLRNVASADGIQRSGDPASTGHHFANVLFNNMRGGVPVLNYDVPVADFLDFLRVRNHGVANRRQALLARLPATITLAELHDIAGQTDDAAFERLCYEYLPFYFSRRHGDPSRPWNRFSILARDESGGRALHYEGNWRDIFQNWEALCTSFPAFLPSVVAKFVNASTVDGFNPYRISRDGVDWETVSTDDPWSNIGYWGDHQIVYLLKLLERMNAHDPALLDSLLGREIFSYAEVPYIIKPFAAILQNPAATIIFDAERAARIDVRVAERGTDGKLLTGPNGSVYHVNLLEKLLVPALSKLSNLVPDAGIWMNTQRPEWNDANNALGAGGVSVVTLCYLRKYLVFLSAILDGSSRKSLPVSTEIAAWFESIESVLEQERAALAGERLAPEERRRILGSLGEAFSEYRKTVYENGLTGKTDLSIESVAGLCRTALAYVDRGIHANRREDGLYHAYNLLEFAADGSGVEIARLDEMLEGQVAVLGSGVLEPEEALRIVERLFASALYRPDQRTFMLYPEKVLPGFLAKNVIPESSVEAIPLAKDLLGAGDASLLARDADGICRFNGSLRNAGDLSSLLDAIAEREEWTAAVARDRGAIADLFEEVFRHRSYTGRSGVMYGYEGLGCIYWHMVAKLLLAVQDTVVRADREDPGSPVREELAELYFRIRAGFGFEKSVAEYGAFPTDPYSHTPPGGGAKQPGMTGHVKEMILTRLGELGIRVEAGAVSFRPLLIKPREFQERGSEFRFIDIGGTERSLPLPAGSLGFTYCQVPVIYERSAGSPRIRIDFEDGSSAERPGSELDGPASAELFSRSGRIARIHVRLTD